MTLRAKVLLGSVVVCSLALLGPSSSARADDVLLASAGHDGVAAAGPRSEGSQANTITLSNLPGPNGGVQWGRAEGVVDAQASDVIAILHDYAQYAGLFPHFEQSRVLSQRGTDAMVYLEARVLHGAATLWSQVRMSAVDVGDTHVVEAKMMKGKSNIGQLLARWEVQAVDHAHTRVVFQLLVDPSLPVPDMLVSGEMKTGAGRAFRALQKRASQRAVFAARPNTAM